MRKAVPYLVFAVLIYIEVVQLGAQTQQPTSANVPAQGSAAATAKPSPDPLLDVPPLPSGQISLVGGTVDRVDRVRNHLTVSVFGGKKMKMFFDERSHIYRDGVETTQLGIRKGDRVYVDTQLDGSRIFARNIRVESSAQPADARGQVLSYDPSRETIVVRDELSSQPVNLRVTSSTAVRSKGQPASVRDLVPGALVKVRFMPDASDRGVAQDIDISARPGDVFVISGKITHLDLSTSTMVVRNGMDGNTYEVRFDPGLASARNAALGADVTVSASFDGSQYTARSMTVSQARAE